MTTMTAVSTNNEADTRLLLNSVTAVELGIMKTIALLVMAKCVSSISNKRNACHEH